MALEYRVHSVGFEVFQPITVATINAYSVGLEVFRPIAAASVLAHSVGIEVWRTVDVLPSSSGQQRCVMIHSF